MTRFNRTLQKTERAQQLRMNATAPERILWSRLRGAQLGESFRRQHPAGPYILDFYCAPKKLCVELDGDQHSTAQGRAHDAARTRFLDTKGISVLRFANCDVRENLDGVCESIWRALHGTPSHTRATRARDLPLSGGGEKGRVMNSPPPERGRPGGGPCGRLTPLNLKSK